MNPFWLLPQKVATVEEAKRIILRYQMEDAASVARNSMVNEILGAVIDVLHQSHPDIDEQLESLLQAAIAVGHEEGLRESLDAMLADFKRALPFSVKQAMIEQP